MQLKHLPLLMALAVAVVVARPQEQEDEDHDTDPTPNPEVIKHFAEATEVLQECKTKFPLSPENLGSFFSTGLLKDETEQNGLCFANCVLEKGKMVVDGAFNPPGAKELIEGRFSLLFGSAKLETDKVSAAVDKCVEGHGTETSCESHYKIWACIYKALRSDDSPFKPAPGHH